MTASNPALSEEIGYTGMRYDAESGSNFADHREYNPLTGDWKSVDPLGIAGGLRNFGDYVGNDPINYVDPTGELLIAIDGTKSKEFRENGGIDYEAGRYQSHARHFTRITTPCLENGNFILMARITHWEVTPATCLAGRKQIWMKR